MNYVVSKRDCENSRGAACCKANNLCTRSRSYYESVWLTGMLSQSEETPHRTQKYQGDGL